MNHKSSFSSLTSLKISDHLQDQCRPFQKIRFGLMNLMNILNLNYLFWNNTDFLTGFDYSVDNESLETLYGLKWGFVFEITGYVYSQKCKKNAKLNWFITFWIRVTFFSKYKQKNASRVSRAQNILTFSFWHFHYTFDYKCSQCS